MKRMRCRTAKRRSATRTRRKQIPTDEEKEIFSKVDSRSIINSMKCSILILRTLEQRFNHYKKLRYDLLLEKHEEKRKLALEGKLPSMIAKRQQLNEMLLQRIKEFRAQRDSKKAFLKLNTKVNLETEVESANETKRIQMRNLECFIQTRIKALDEEYLNAAVHAELRVRRELDRSYCDLKPVSLDFAERPNGPNTNEKRRKPLITLGPIVVNQLADERTAYISDVIRGAVLRRTLENDMQTILNPSSPSDAE
ncbi:hypothetical protein T4B_7879 [Trichinella pseudospiralis]|uniref:Uncharacterized protein n=2 Tax=Trichinella pseudospiralis TaxID=6337 RepID=A0A0V1JEQ5_TRIPS|nr:hypothetical protein T4A_2039 [Trichinella pseudospiralis]KRY86549.1 hypothetical protein T4D_12733 [Trichinella pseudospiralis]KRZ33490.1 hypothetical protein T4B_7879 [Trichinella pseudospiralis]KRZ41314.1 hypothetical protein T4C_3408 [Trichinella pseudospiralis]